LFLAEQWSPEQIANRLKVEGRAGISHNTIYRAIYAGLFDTPEQKRSKGNRGTVRRLRHRGKTRHTKGMTEHRGKIVVNNRIHDRPPEASERCEIGHWEVDTVAGKGGSACVITMVDMSSRFLRAGKIDKLCSDLTAGKMIELFSELPVSRRKSVTTDRGKEFAKHAEVTAALGGLQFYFSDPHSPWQRGHEREHKRPDKGISA
jgi:IS30 family transposase